MLPEAAIEDGIPALPANDPGKKKAGEFILSGLWVYGYLSCDAFTYPA